MNAPPNQSLNYQPQAQPFLVLVGDPDGSPVQPTQILDYVELVRLTLSAGGHRLDHALLNYSLANRNEHLVDKKVPYDFSRKVQVWLADNQGNQLAGGALLSAELASETAKLDRSGEFSTLVARLDPWHFGDPLLGPMVLDTDDVAKLSPDLPIAFNPEIDGIIEPNMVPVQSPNPGHVGQIAAGAIGGGNKYYQAWIDPESCRTDAARKAQQALLDATGTAQKPALWDLANAVNSLCLAANPNEDTIVNPTLDELQKVFGQRPPALVNVVLPRGKRLPELLDELLPRFGFNWFVDCSDDGAGTVTNYLRVFQLGAGQQKALYMQRPASPPKPLALASNTACDVGVSWDIANLANVIVGQGAWRELEITVELYRGWLEDEDTLTADQLRKTDETAADDPGEESQFKQHPNAWRKWVLNEGGDYCSTRKNVAAIPAAPFSLKSIFAAAGAAASPTFTSDTLVKRRRFHHCLTKDNFGERRDVYVQYRDPTVASEGDPEAWKPLPKEEWSNCAFHVLEKECGIYFSSPTPPPDLMEIDTTGGQFGTNGGPGKARLRVTAVVRSDDRLEQTAQRQDQSPNLNAIKLFVDLSDRFHWRQILQTGTYASALKAETFGDDQVDDTASLTSYVSALQTVEQAARINCEIELFGIHAGYSIGQLITSIDGRNISLNRNSPKQSTPLYPQITGITYDRQKQKTILQVETFDFTAPLLKKLSF